ncbi:hypothetical protein LXL04_024324 [Taraxacum kok-saghyz]
MVTGSFLLPVTQPVKYIERKIVKGRGGASDIFLRQSNSEGKDPVVLPTPKKVDSPKQKRNAGYVISNLVYPIIDLCFMKLDEFLIVAFSLSFDLISMLTG